MKKFNPSIKNLIGKKIYVSRLTGNEASSFTIRGFLIYRNIQTKPLGKKIFEVKTKNSWIKFNEKDIINIEKDFEDNKYTVYLK